MPQSENNYLCIQIRLMIQLSERLLAMEESATIAMSRKSRELKAQGLDVISLSLGEPDFHTPQFIKDAAVEAMEQNYTMYTPVPGYDDLRESISEKFRRDNNLMYDKSQIVVSTGAKQSIANVVLSLINPGDEVIIPAPYWVSYLEIVKVAEGIPVVINAGIEKDFKITGADLEAAITPKTKLFMFSTPCNPTGSVYSKEELQDIANVLKKYPHIVAMSDEIYEHINFSGTFCSIGSIPGMLEKTVTVNGVAKAFAMTGWRIGFIAAAKWIADGIEKLQGQVTSGTNSIAQKAAVAAFNGSLDHAYEMKAAYDRRRKLVVEKLREIPGFKVNMPDGAFYAFPDISYYFGKTDGKTVIKDSDDFCSWLLADAFVATVAGSGFGAPDCMRISTAAADEQLVEACDRIKAAVAKLK